ncbi:MAG: hypothetical protein IPF99_41670 [Deltaproteobacteria bacterium]|nr:hypothetical protein [Deltaproteobacteria bacterium]
MSSRVKRAKEATEACSIRPSSRQRLASAARVGASSPATSPSEATDHAEASTIVAARASPRTTIGRPQQAMSHQR